ncbi:MAG: MBL fold metallo-hydrolase [Kofleriaceae bacterium]
MAVVLGAACAGPSVSSSRSTVQVQQPGRAERLQIGALEAYALEDGHLEVPNDGQLLGVGRPPGEVAALLAAAGLARDTIRLDIQCLLVKAGDRVVLFDTGMGEGSGADTGHLADSLARAKVAPSAVTDVFISHAHGDHVGGLVTKAGDLAFPAATIHLTAVEWAAVQASTDDESKRFVAVTAAKVSAFEPGAQVLPFVRAVATPGHTPGHSSYEIGAEPDKVFYTGDLVHHSVISVQRPAWSIQVDGAQPAAAAARQQALARLAAEHTRVFAVHFPFPGIGYVVPQGPGHVWKPASP